MLSLGLAKCRLLLPFWYQLTRVVLKKGPLNGCVQYVCGVCACGPRNNKDSNAGNSRVDELPTKTRFRPLSIIGSSLISIVPIVSQGMTSY